MGSDQPAVERDHLDDDPHGPGAPAPLSGGALLARLLRRPDDLAARAALLALGGGGSSCEVSAEARLAAQARAEEAEALAPADPLAALRRADAAVAADPTGTAGLLAGGRAAHLAGLQDVARLLLRAAVERDPSDPVALRRLARLAMFTGDLPEAGRLYGRLRLLDPDDDEARTLAASVSPDQPWWVARSSASRAFARSLAEAVGSRRPVFLLGSPTSGRGAAARLLHALGPGRGPLVEAGCELADAAARAEGGVLVVRAPRGLPPDDATWLAAALAAPPGPRDPRLVVVADSISAAEVRFAFPSAQDAPASVERPIVLVVPGLARRGEDVPELLVRAHGVPHQFSAEAAAQLARLPWSEVDEQQLARFAAALCEAAHEADPYVPTRQVLERAHVDDALHRDRRLHGLVDEGASARWYEALRLASRPGARRRRRAHVEALDDGPELPRDLEDQEAAQTRPAVRAQLRGCAGADDRPGEFAGRPQGSRTASSARATEGMRRSAVVHALGPEPALPADGPEPALPADGPEPALPADGPQTGDGEVLARDGDLPRAWAPPLPWPASRGPANGADGGGAPCDGEEPPAADAVDAADLARLHHVVAWALEAGQLPPALVAAVAAALEDRALRSADLRAAPAPGLLGGEGRGPRWPQLLLACGALALSAPLVAALAQALSGT